MFSTYKGFYRVLYWEQIRYGGDTSFYVVLRTDPYLQNSL